MNISNLAAKILTLLLVSSLVWGAVFAVLGVWLFGTSVLAAWTIALSILGGMVFCVSLMCWEFYQSFDPAELQDDEGNEFLEAVMLGADKF